MAPPCCSARLPVAADRYRPARRFPQLGGLERRTRVHGCPPRSRQRREHLGANRGGRGLAGSSRARGCPGRTAPFARTRQTGGLAGLHRGVSSQHGWAHDCPGGIVVDMRPFASMVLDPTTDLLRVGTGAIWSDVLAYLDPLGRSVAIMQSNDSFTVGGSVSVNCHGWQHGRPPIASSVRSFRILLADGQLLECSREENAELFSLALGGYGLFGILIDVDLEVVAERTLLPGGDGDRNSAAGRGLLGTSPRSRSRIGPRPSLDSARCAL